MADIYKFASKALLQVLFQSKSVKQAVYSLFDTTSYNRLIPAVASLTTGVVANYEILYRCLPSCGSDLDVHRLPPKIPSYDGKPARQIVDDDGSRKIQTSLYLLTMIYDLIYKGSIRGGGVLKKRVLSNEQKFKEIARTEDITLRRQDNSDRTAIIPRYIFVDLYTVARQEVVDSLKSVLTEHQEGAIAEDPFFESVVSVNAIGGLDSSCRKLPCFQNGSASIIDRASCLCYRVLGIKPGDVVFDFCASPGSKTLTYLSALGSRGLIVAVEKDHSRFENLCQRLQKESRLTRLTPIDELGGNRVKVLWNPMLPYIGIILLQADILKLKFCDKQCPQQSSGHVCLRSVIQYGRERFQLLDDNLQIKISLDPSCSGSGLPDNGDFNVADEKYRHRIAILSEFQCKILKHVLEFPLITVCTYSTCSLWYEENEGVVEKVVNDINMAPDWEIQRALSVEEEKLFGKTADVQSLYGLSELPPALATEYKYIRTSIATHQCRGFFVAKLVRKELGRKQTNQINPPR